MALKKISFKTIAELKSHIKTHEPTFYFSSKTSTVIPYDKLEQIYAQENFYLADLSMLPSSMELKGDNLIIKGPISWKEAKIHLRSQGRNIKTAPTEELALISSGAATSATGERCFHFGNLRSQIIQIKYLDYNGEEQTVRSDKNLDIDDKNFKAYQTEFSKYSSYKNAPFPRLQMEIDLLIGTEGQLGVITELEIETADDCNVQHLFMLLPKWETNHDPHIEVIDKIQNFRDNVFLCELIDSNSFNYLPENERPNKGLDAVFFEVQTDYFEKFYEDFLLNLSFLNEENVFEMSESKFHQLRSSIPRAVFEENSMMGITKMGIDVQIKIQDFAALLKIYKNFTKLGVKYNLFGHFGDAHLHFNFMPLPEQVTTCQEQLETLYNKVLSLEASPFAEHGIGIIKQKYIREFWAPCIFNIFEKLKRDYDPHNQFFPQGYMNLKGDL